MERLGHFVFRQDKRRYAIELAHDQRGTIPTRDEYELKLSVSEPDGKIVTETAIGLAVRPEEQRLEISHDDKPVGSIPLDRDVEPSDEIPEWQDIIAGLSESDPIETIIDSIPAIDPILGCVIRGSVSATVGQFLRCWPQCRDVSDFRERARGLAGCLGANFWRIVGTAMLRIGKCVVKAGFA